MKQKEQEKKGMQILFVYVIPCALILFFCLYYLKSNTSLKVVPDEYGYWAAAAYMTGTDWAEITSFNSYYGFGYGVILAPILYFTDHGVLAYQIAMIVNAILVCGIYLIVLNVLEEICPELKTSVKTVTALAAVLYTGTIYYAQFTLAEIPLIFVYWLIVLLACKLLKKVTVIRLILFSVLAVYIFSIHQRAIGITIICAMFWVYLFVKKCKNKKQFLVVGLVLAACIVGVFVFKENYQSAFFPENGVYTNVNDFGGQHDKIMQLFSIQGIWKFIKGYFGKIYYACSGTFLLAPIALVAVLRTIVKDWKEKRLSEALIFQIFLFFSLGIMMAIDTVFMIEYNGRFDTLCYGRYFDFTVGPLIVVALLYLYESKLCRKEIAAVIAGYIGLSLAVNSIMNYEGNISVFFLSCPGIADIPRMMDYRENCLLVVSARCILIFLLFLVLYFTLQKKKKNILIGAIVGLSSINWLMISQYVYEGCLSWAKQVCEWEERLAETILEEGAEDSLCYYVSEGAFTADYLQFLLQDHSISCFEDVEEISSFSSDTCVLTVYNATSISDRLVNAGYEVIFESYNLTLWKQK